MEPAHATTNPPASLGEFRIHAVLGQGGSGIVYDASWGPRRVALKVLHTALVGTGKDRAQFLGEAQRLQQIGHPSVVKVLAVGELPDGRPYLAMERLEGETLATLIARGRLALDRALALFGELCSAVTALHDQGLVHRDLKPENVFVVADRHAVLLDFGITKDLAAPASTTTQEGNVRGTPAYMAPERFFGQVGGARRPMSTSSRSCCTRCSRASCRGTTRRPRSAVVTAAADRARAGSGSARHRDPSRAVDACAEPSRECLGAVRGGGGGHK